MTQYGPEGDPITAKIAVVGEAPGRTEISMGRPLVGPSGRLFDWGLKNAGIKREDCFITNCFDREVDKDRKNNIWINDEVVYTDANGITATGEDYILRLKEELSRFEGSVVLALGAVALEALTGERKILNWRGSPVKCKLAEHLTVIATVHPSYIIRGNFLARWYMLMDMQKVKRHSRYPELPDLGHKIFYNRPHKDLLDKLDWIKNNCDKVSWDIEVTGTQCSRISFAWTPKEVMVVSFEAGWSEEEEILLWDKIASILEDPDIANIGCNLMFDIAFLLQTVGILVRGDIYDVMVSQHLIYPDFPKSLAFTQSLYTDVPYHKDMVRHGDVVKKDG